MFTQMIMNENKDKIYIYDDEDTPGCRNNKLFTIAEGGSDVSSQVIEESKFMSDKNSELMSNKASFGHRKERNGSGHYRYSQYTESNFRPTNESDFQPIAEDSYEQSAMKSPSEVKFSSDTVQTKNTNRKVRLRSNSPPSEENTLEEEVSCPQFRLSSMPDSDEVVCAKNSVDNSNPNFILCTRTQNTFKDIIDEYSIIEKEDLENSDAEIRVSSRPEAYIPCQNLQEDEVTVIKFTPNSNDASVESSIIENYQNGRRTQRRRYQASIESKDKKIKLANIDLTNSIEDDSEMFSKFVNLNAKDYANWQSIETVKPKFEPNITNKTLVRQPRVIKDSIGTLCDHHCDESEFSPSPSKQVPEKRLKPVFSPLKIPSGDNQKPVGRISEVQHVRCSPKRSQKSKELSNHYTKEKDLQMIKREKFKCSPSPRTRNRTSGIDLNTSAITIQKSFLKQGSLASLFQSPDACKTSRNPYTTPHPHHNHSKSPIGPSRTSLSPKTRAKVLTHLPTRQSPQGSQNLSNYWSGRMSNKTGLSSRKCSYSSQKTGTKPKLCPTPLQNISNIDMVNCPIESSRSRATPLSSSMGTKDLMEFNKSIMTVNSYKEQINLLNTQNQQMVSCISYLKEELHKAIVIANDAQKRAEYLSQKSSLKENAYNNLQGSRCYPTLSSQCNTKDGAENYDRNTLRRGHSPANPFKTNNETVKFSTSARSSQLPSGRRLFYEQN
ncbi:unnamed protein product [Moneuplotes crassus]|uniref:Uncharacterized protein n=1 Tax=Euplotes crassus TaxID=5936 RepID=A0AAD1X0V2_EUPCR|nr:unnamed protein product [Moneuplotes crassus]